MDFLLVDPSDIMLKLIPGFLSAKVSVGVVFTEKGIVPENIDADNVSIIELRNNSWNNQLQIVSAVAWSYPGYQFLESISNQILLSNIDNKIFKLHRQQQYLTNPVRNGTTYFETLSYKGRHVLINASKFNDSKWSVGLDFDQQLTDQIELVWANLDNTGVINGPCQTYLLPDGSIKLKFNTANASWVANKGLVTRHLLDVWPWVVEAERTNPKRSINRFYSWVERTGNAKRFRLRNVDES